MTELRSVQGCKVMRGSTTVEIMEKYDRFLLNLKSQGGFVHGSQSHVTPKQNTMIFEYTIFIYYEVPKGVNIEKL